jgi:hypothetical protein
MMRITRLLQLAFAAVVAGNASTLYVSYAGSPRIGEYDATTGAAINVNLITGDAGGLALSGPGPLDLAANGSFPKTYRKWSFVTYPSRGDISTLLKRVTFLFCLDTCVGNFCVGNFLTEETSGGIVASV